MQRYYVEHPRAGDDLVMEIRMALRRTRSKGDLAELALARTLTGAERYAVVLSHDTIELVDRVLGRLLGEGLPHDESGKRFFLEGDSEPVVDLDELRILEMNDALREADVALTGVNLAQAHSHYLRLIGATDVIQPAWGLGEGVYPLSFDRGALRIDAGEAPRFRVELEVYPNKQVGGVEEVAMILRRLEGRLRDTAYAMSTAGLDRLQAHALSPSAQAAAVPSYQHG